MSEKSEKSILLIARVPDRAGPIARELRRACGRSVKWAAELHEDCLGGCALVLFWLDRRDGYDPLVAVLQAGSLSRKPAPVVVLSDHHDAEQALTCFRLGVTDYLSLSDHRAALPGVVSTLLGGRAPAATAGLSGFPFRVWKAVRAHPVLEN